MNPLNQARDTHARERLFWSPAGRFNSIGRSAASHGGPLHVPRTRETLGARNSSQEKCAPVFFSSKKTVNAFKSDSFGKQNNLAVRSRDAWSKEFVTRKRAQKENSERIQVKFVRHVEEFRDRSVNRFPQRKKTPPSSFGMKPPNYESDQWAPSVLPTQVQMCKWQCTPTVSTFELEYSLFRHA